MHTRREGGAQASKYFPFSFPREIRRCGGLCVCYLLLCPDEGERTTTTRRAAVPIDRLMKHLVPGYLLSLLMRAARAQQNEKPVGTTKVLFFFFFNKRVEIVFLGVSM